MLVPLLCKSAVSMLWKTCKRDCRRPGDGLADFYVSFQCPFFQGSEEWHSVFHDFYHMGQDLDSCPYKNQETSLLPVASQSWAHTPKGCFLLRTARAWKGMVLSWGPEKCDAIPRAGAFSFCCFHLFLQLQAWKIKVLRSHFLVWGCLYFRFACLTFTKWYKGFLWKKRGE